MASTPSATTESPAGAVTSPFNQDDPPSPARQIYQNDLILDQICSTITSNITLKNLMVADKRCFAKAAGAMYNSVEQTTIDKLVQARCSFARMHVYIHSVRSLNVIGAQWPKDVEISTLSGQYPRLRFIRFTVPGCHGAMSCLEIFDQEEDANVAVQAERELSDVIGRLWLNIPCLQGTEWALHDSKLELYGVGKRFHLAGLQLGRAAGYAMMKLNATPDRDAAHAIVMPPKSDDGAAIFPLPDYWKDIFRYTQDISLNCDMDLSFMAELVSAVGDLKRLAISSKDESMKWRRSTSPDESARHALSTFEGHLKRELPQLEYLAVFTPTYVPLSYLPVTIPACEYLYAPYLMGFHKVGLDLPIMPPEDEQARPPPVDDASTWFPSIPSVTQGIIFAVTHVWHKLDPYIVGQILYEGLRPSMKIHFRGPITSGGYPEWEQHVRKSRLASILTERYLGQRGYRKVAIDATGKLIKPVKKCWQSVPSAELDALLLGMTHQQKAETAAYFNLPYPEQKSEGDEKEKAGSGASVEGSKLNSGEEEEQDGLALQSEDQGGVEAA